MADYISYIRGMVGHKPVMLCGSGILIYRGNEILLQLRGDNGCWGDSGGCVEMGECTEEAARRELHEETGLTAREIKLLGVFSGEGMHYTYPNGDEVYYISIAYYCDDFSGELSPQPEEVKELRWFDIDDLPDNINPASLNIINEFCRRMKAGAL